MESASCPVLSTHCSLNSRKWQTTHNKWLTTTLRTAKQNAVTACYLKCSVFNSKSIELLCQGEKCFPNKPNPNLQDLWTHCLTSVMRAKDSEKGNDPNHLGGSGLITPSLKGRNHSQVCWQMCNQGDALLWFWRCRKEPWADVCGPPFWVGKGKETDF